MKTRRDQVAVLYVTCVCMYITHVASYLLHNNNFLTSSPSSPCNNRLRLNKYQKTKLSNGRVIHHLVLHNPAVLSRVDVDLDQCAAGRSYSMADIHMEYIDGSDIMDTKRRHSISMNVDRNHHAYYVFDPTIYAKEVFFTTVPNLRCASMNLGGCSPSHIMRSCYHGVSVRNDLCACQRGYYGDRCGKSINEMPFDEFTYLHEVRGLVLANDGDFEIHGEVQLAVSSKGYTDNALQIQGKGGHIHLQHTHSDKIQSANHYHSPSTRSVFSGTRAFASSTQIMVGSHHDASHQIYFYNTHHNQDHANPGVSLVYRGHALQMDVHTGSRMYSLSVPWYPNHRIQHVTSSFSPQYGCSIYVDGKHLGSVTDSGHARWNTSSVAVDGLCMGSCKYCYHNCYHNQAIPHAEYWLGATYAAGASLSQLVLNNKLSCIGVSSIGGGGGSTNFSVSQLTPTVPQLTPTVPTHTTTRTATRLAPPPSTTTTTDATATAPKAVTATSPRTTTPSISTKPVPSPSNTTALLITGTPASTASHSGQGLLCYSCTMSATDGACNSLTTCSAGQVCAAYHDPTGYTHTCLDKNVCSTAKSLVQSNCWECCEYSLCNKQCAPAVQCEDTSTCAILVSTGYNVCSDPSVAKDECKKTCGLC